MLNHNVQPKDELIVLIKHTINMQAKCQIKHASIKRAGQTHNQHENQMPHQHVNQTL